MSSTKLSMILTAAMLSQANTLFLTALDKLPEPKAAPPTKEELTRRAEKNARALAKAEAKRQRKQAKRR